MERIIEFLRIYKNKIVASIIFGGITVMLFWGVYFFNTMKAKADSIEFNDAVVKEEINNVEKTTHSTQKIKIDIKGEVNKPGVYELEDNNRVVDAIKKAGDLTKKADTSSINLSKKLYDEMVIVIYSKDQVKKIEQTKKDETKANEECKQNNNKIQNDACIDKNSTVSNNNTPQKNKININTAALDELETLPGVGETKARAIIEYRSENGKFEKIEDIKNVSGIGDALFEKIKDYITV